MAKETHDHVELLHPDLVAAIPNLGLGDVVKWLPILEKLRKALKTGTGSFSTFTPIGKRWVVILDHEPAGDP